MKRFIAAIGVLVLIALIIILKAALAGPWQEIAAFSESDTEWVWTGVSKTDPFQTPKEWRVNWSAERVSLGHLIISVRDYRDRIAGDPISAMDAPSGTAYYEGPGQRYLQIQNEGYRYKIVVEGKQ